jgi:glycosylphosphatidylinositol transamidase (GPIT) subunit GPI8
MPARSITAVVILLFLAVFISQAQLVLGDVYLGQPLERHAVICNTGNDFPDYYLEEVDSFPAQSIQAYLALKKLGYQDDQITLMVYHTNDDLVDVDGDGNNDLGKAVIDYENGAVTKENLRAELMRLASTAGSDSEVVIYIVGHGGYAEGNVVFAFEDGSRVSYEELIGWLDGLNSNRVVLLFDFCYSGSFLGNKFPFTGTYITSASDGNVARSTGIGST